MNLWAIMKLSWRYKAWPRRHGGRLFWILSPRERFVYSPDMGYFTEREGRG